MATRVKMLKLLQEMRGVTSFANRRPQTRPPGALVLPMTGFRTRHQPRKQIIRILIQDPPDIPSPVRIVFLPTVDTASPISQDGDMSQGGNAA